MDDKQIIELYWQRSESAIAETAEKYGGYCRSIAYNILHSEEDSQECVNDTYLAAWNSMPPKRPSVLRTFLGRLTRNLSLNMYEKSSAEKRGGGQTELALDELSECIPAPNGTECAMDDIALTELLDRFLVSLSARQRRIFMRRYWYFSPVREISAELGIGESSVKMSLFRSRNKLRQLLEKEGVSI